VSPSDRVTSVHGEATADAAADARAPRSSQPCELDVPLGDQLFADPSRFGFFQAVRLLQGLYPRRRPVGGDNAPREEAVHFRSRESLSFPPSQIAQLREPGADQADNIRKPTEMVVNFFGLLGPAGALPRHYTELVMQRVRAKDFTLRDFLGLFEHRLISLFFRAWEKYRFWLGFERAETRSKIVAERGPEATRAFELDERPRLDPFSQHLLDLAGLGEPALRYRLGERRSLALRHEVEDATCRHYAGIFAQTHRSAVALEQMLADFFSLPVTIEQFHGQWLTLAEADQTRLIPQLGNTQLGTSVVIGERVWDVQGMFRVRLGPLTYAQFRRFVPAGESFRPLKDLTRLYAGQQFEFDVQLELLASEVPQCQLPGRGNEGVRLGWDSWVRNRPMPRNVDDAVFGGQPN
jgi:type VI secretion system protein ImpH